jgi:ClpX C4-type zinc finger protein
MVLEEQLLTKARHSGERVAAVDRDALLARAEYHAAVRRLHLAGGSLREIAEALGISHQRVAQIVDAAGGSWWQRVWRTRTPRRDAVCTFCGRPPSEIEKLVAGPNVYACDGCVALAERAVAAGPTKAFGVARKAGKKCSFCGKGSSAERAVATGEHANVCVACLKTCREIIGA